MDPTGGNKSDRKPGTKLGARRRMLLAQRLRGYFDGLRAELDADSEAFFQSVIARAEAVASDPRRPQHGRR